jgi:hypothetical protein
MDTPGMKMNVDPAAIVGSMNESAGEPFSEKTSPVIANELVLTNANNRPSLATPGFAAKAASMVALPVF